IAGTTLFMDETQIHIRTTRSVAVLTDVRLNFDFCLEAHCFGDIYAKCTAVEMVHGSYHCALHVTAMEEKDRAVIRKWMAEAAA
ncbi:MAG: hypothetical protein R6V15_04240, partial [Desulfotignum sp.]